STSRSSGSVTDRAFSTAVLISSRVTSLGRDPSVTPPRLVTPLICEPATEITAFPTWHPASFSASSTALWMLCTALSSSTMMPLREPRLSAIPCPRYRKPASVASQISATVLALPTSSTVIMFEGYLPLLPIIRVLIKQLLATSFWPLALSLDCKPLAIALHLLAKLTNRKSKNRVPVIYPITKLPIYQIFYLCALCVLCGELFFAFAAFGLAGFALTGFNTAAFCCVPITRSPDFPISRSLLSGFTITCPSYRKSTDCTFWNCCRHSAICAT